MLKINDSIYLITQDGVFDARDILKELDRVYRKRLAFRFKVAPDNTRHSVSQLFEDDALIEFVLPKLLALQHQVRFFQLLSCLIFTLLITNCLGFYLIKDEASPSILMMHEINDVGDSVSYLLFPFIGVF